MTATIGAPAPPFQAEAYVRGEAEPCQVSLADQYGSWVVLFFYPRDFTFVCPTELNAFAQLAPVFAEEDAVVIGVSTDSYWSHQAWFETHPLLAGVDFPVLADTTQRIAADYGVLTADGSALRGTFVIDPDGVVRHATVSDQNVGRSVDETLRVLQALRTGALCPVAWQPGQPTLVAA
jgi:peroxiredoxin (alkyl hydroperoxide reductase subunit C)